jgi:hypothetical protein
VDRQWIEKCPGISPWEQTKIFTFELISEASGQREKGGEPMNNLMALLLIT